MIGGVCRRRWQHVRPDHTSQECSVRSSSSLLPDATRCPLIANHPWEVKPCQGPALQPLKDSPALANASKPVLRRVLRQPAGERRRPAVRRLYYQLLDLSSIRFSLSQRLEKAFHMPPGMSRVGRGAHLRAVPRQYFRCLFSVGRTQLQSTDELSVPRRLRQPSYAMPKEVGSKAVITQHTQHLCCCRVSPLRRTRNDRAPLRSSLRIAR